MGIRSSPTARARKAVLVALVGGLAVLASGCFFADAEEHEQSSPLTRPWFCNSVGNGTPLSGHGNGNHVHPAYEGKKKAPLSWDDCKELGHQLDHALTFARQWPTKGAAEADGWMQVAQYIPGLGTHHARLPAGIGRGSLPGGTLPTGALPTGTRPTGTLPGGTRPTGTIPGIPGIPGGTIPRPPGSLPQFTFKDGEPTFLIYGGPGPDAPLVGVSYASISADNTPPEAFAGGNDWYHLHTSVCVEPGTRRLINVEETTDEECRAQGGVRQQIFTGGIFLLHVWLVPGYEYKPDIFASGHPCLGETGPLPKTDPCWKDIAFRDPSLGPPTTLPAPPGGAGGAGDHGAHGH